MPVEVSVTGSVALDPTVTLPKSRLAGLTVRVAVPLAAAVSPEPAREACATGFAAEFSAVNIPEKPVFAFGVKLISTLYDAPGAIVTGRLFWPVMEKVWPAAVSCETSTALEPLLESVTLTIADCPIWTEPKSTELGLTTRLPELPFESLAACTFAEYPHPANVSIRVTQHARRT